MPNSVKPKAAATLIAWRRGRAGLEVLMGRRAGRHRFMPHHYVFPGGRVDRKDYDAPASSPLRSEVLRQIGDPRLAHAHAIAAARETWEETGLALGDPARPALRPLAYALRAITPPASPIRFHARFFTVEATHLCGTLAGNGELLDLAWRPVAECLKLPIVDVTEYTLRRMLEGPLDGASPVLFSFRNGKALAR